MPLCHRLEKNLECRYWCKPNWIFCHNYYDGLCLNDVVDSQCENGWHVTEKRYKKITKHRKWKRDPEREELFDDEGPKAKKCKRDPLLEIYLTRFGYKPDEMPDRREIEDVFLDTTRSSSEFTYEEYSEAFQYIVDIIMNGVPE